MGGCCRAYPTTVIRSTIIGMAKLRDRYNNAVDVEEVLLDASNIPAFNRDRLEGKRELPLAKRSVRTVWYIFLAIALVFLIQIYLKYISMYTQ